MPGTLSSKREPLSVPSRTSSFVSIVMPCLNEADTVGKCVDKALRGLRNAGLEGEVIVADNGSTDGSIEIAINHGARVVNVKERGYGRALMGGIAAAPGPFIVMGDADDSYDFLQVPEFVAKLEEGYDIVQGCRLPRGGGTIMPGAMPFLHRWLGNPMFSRLARLWFRVPVNDIYCGLRAFRKDFYESLGQRCTGMEFANEMILRAALVGGRICELPTVLWPDGRKAHRPHLRTFRDGWRTLRFYLIFSPRWAFLLPGLALLWLGLLGYAIALPGLSIGSVRFDVHTLLFASLAIICGYQSVAFGVLTKTFAIRDGFLPRDRRLEAFVDTLSLERCLVASSVVILLGLLLLLVAVGQWWNAGFGDLDYAVTMRWVIPGMTMTVIGFLTVMGSLFLTVLGNDRL